MTFYNFLLACAIAGHVCAAYFVFETLRVKARKALDLLHKEKVKP